MHNIHDYGQYMVIGGFFDKVIIDKATKTITVRNAHSLFRKRVIPFSDVLHVRASANTRTVYRFTNIPYVGSRLSLWAQDKTYWETVLELPGHKKVMINGIAQQYPERLVIGQSSKREPMVNLADEINK